MKKFFTLDFAGLNRGVIYMAFAALMLSFMGGFIKVLSLTIPTIEVVFFRSAIGAFLLFLTILRAPIVQKGGHIWLLIFRGVFGYISFVAFFYNIAHIALSDAMMYSRISPIFTAIFAMVFLKESIGKRGWIAIAIGFAGVVCVIQPTMGFDRNHIFGFVNAICAALAFTSIRELRQFYDVRSIVLSTMILGAIFSAILMLISEFYFIESLDFILGKFVVPSSKEWLFLICVGIFSSLSQTYMTKAYAVSKAGIVAVISYATIIFSLIIGFFMGDSLPNTLAFMGIFLIIFGGAINAKRT